MYRRRSYGARSMPTWARAILRELRKKGRNTYRRGRRRIGLGRRSNFAPSGDPRPGYWAGGRFNAWRL